MASRAPLDGIDEPVGGVDEQAALGLRTLGRDPSEPARAERLAGSLSGSGVFRLRYAERPDVVLKVTTGEGTPRRNARRELRAYRELLPRLPVATPRLLDAAETARATAMVVSAHEGSGAAPDWTDAQWLEVVDELATLHESAERPEDAAPRWMPTVLASAAHAEVARAYWRKTTAQDTAERLLRETARIAAVLEAAPTGLVHGDCHVDNLLRGSDGRLIWADWQGVGVGPGAAELAFLWERAEIDGATPPREEMLERYARRRSLDLAGTRRIALAAELTGVLVAWPEYAPLEDDAARDRITRRLEALGTAWAALDSG